MVIFRNPVGDYGTDYLHTHPGSSHTRHIVSWEGDFSGLGWHDLARTGPHR
ncbi:hypothetical protein [Streptomyces sp. NPDC001774]